MLIKVLFFGQLKDIVGCAEESIEIGEGERIGAVFERYQREYPRMAALAGSIVIACNQQFSSAAAPLKPGDEIAFLPPVSGGSDPFTHKIEDEAGGHLFALTRAPIDPVSLKRRLLRGEDGAAIIFEGVVRNNTKGRPTLFLDYECYEAMAIKVMAEIGLSIAAERQLGRIAIVHRLGRMEIGETSVVIVVTAPHRKPAFEAALDGINRLKKLVPIWKKEYFADGEVWVDGEWDDSVTKARS